MRQLPCMFGNGFQITSQRLCNMLQAYPRLVRDQSDDLNAAVVGDAFEVPFQLFCCFFVPLHRPQYTTTFSHSAECENVVVLTCLPGIVFTGIAMDKNKDCVVERDRPE